VRQVRIQPPAGTTVALVRHRAFARAYISWVAALSEVPDVAREGVSVILAFTCAARSEIHLLFADAEAGQPSD
jgi:hypothetical protein